MKKLYLCDTIVLVVRLSKSKEFFSVLKRVVYFLWASLIFLTIGQNASAQQFLSTFEKKLPELKLLSEEEFEKETKIVEEYPIGARELAYSIRVPKSWRISDNVSLGSFSISDKFFSNVARYTGPANLRGVTHHVSVQVKTLGYQMTAKQWFVDYVLENGFNVGGVNIIDDKNIDVLYVYVDQGVSYAVRAAIRIHGKNLVFVQYVIPVQDWGQHRVMQTQVVDSFALKEKSDELIESFNTHRILDIAQLKYPETWELKPHPIRSIDRMSVSVARIASEEEILAGRKKTRTDPKKMEALYGRITFDILSNFVSKDVDKEIENYKLELSDVGLFVEEEVSGYEDSDFMTENAPDLKLETHVYNLIDKYSDLQGYEYWITVTAYGDYYYYTTLLTPSRGTDFVEWGRNTQAYRLAVQSFMSQERAKSLGIPSEE